MNETHGFSKQYNVCINEIAFISEWCLVTLHGLFASVFKNKVADQIAEG